MDIFSPKDGFVVRLIAVDRSHVELGARLIEMDTDDEQRDVDRSKKMDLVRNEMASQYSGDELKTNRRIAEIAHLIALDDLNSNILLQKLAQTAADVHNGISADLVKANSALAQAKLNEEKAQLQLDKFDAAVARHVRINDIVLNFMKHDVAALEKKRDRLVVLAPQAGSILYKVKQNCFAELGSLIATIS